MSSKSNRPVQFALRGGHRGLNHQYWWWWSIELNREDRGMKWTTNVFPSRLEIEHQSQSETPLIESLGYRIGVHFSITPRGNKETQQICITTVCRKILYLEEITKDKEPRNNTSLKQTTINPIFHSTIFLGIAFPFTMYFLSSIFCQMSVRQELLSILVRRHKNSSSKNKPALFNNILAVARNFQDTHSSVDGCWRTKNYCPHRRSTHTNSVSVWIWN